MSEENTKLEEEFKAVVAEVTPQIDEQLKIAREAIRKAEELSEKYGVPFRSSVSPLGQSYFPKKVPDGLDQDFVFDVTGTWTEYYGDGSGWQHSAVC